VLFFFDQRPARHIAGIDPDSAAAGEAAQ